MREKEEKRLKLLREYEEKLYSKRNKIYCWN